MNGMNQNRSGPWNSLAVLVIVLVLLGGIGAVGFAKTDLGNFFHARAEAQKMAADTAWEGELRQIDLPYIQVEREAASEARLAQMDQEAQLAEARTQAELKKIEEERVAALAAIQEQQRMGIIRNNQQLANEAQWLETYVFSARIGVTVFMVCGSIIITTYFRKRISMPQTVHTGWNDVDYRKREIALARSRERQAREAELEQRDRHNDNLHHQPRPRDSQQPYHDLPEAS